MNFENYKFRASEVGLIMTPSKKLSAKDKYNKLVESRDSNFEKFQKAKEGSKTRQSYEIKVNELNVQIEQLEPYIDVVELSATAKSFLETIYIREVYDRVLNVDTKYTKKGNECEQTSIDLLNSVEGEFFTKNVKRFENEYVEGTPDITGFDLIIDIKTKWDIWGFMSERGGSRQYYWQLQSYMWLTGSQYSRLVYTLVDAPEHLIYSEFQKELYASGLDIDSQEAQELEDQVRKNMTYGDIPEQEKIKSYDINFNSHDIELLQNYIKAARAYLGTLKLNKL